MEKRPSSQRNTRNGRIETHKMEIQRKRGQKGVGRPETEGKDPERGGDRDSERKRDPQRKVRDGSGRYAERGTETNG